jgi:N utilization substance protein B
MSAPAQTSFRQRRSATRLAAVQALYALEVSGGAVGPVLAEVAQRRWIPAEKAANAAAVDPAFLHLLVEGVVARRAEFDAAIDAALAHGWTTGRLEILLLAILRAGAFELAQQPHTPIKVVINEYVEIAHAFFAGREPSLVNAVLDRLAARLRDAPPDEEGAFDPGPDGGTGGAPDGGMGGGTGGGS